MKALITAAIAVAVATAAFADVLTPCFVSHIVRDANDTLWFNCGTSLGRLNAIESISLFDSHNANGVGPLAFDSDGTLWFGSNGGSLYRFVNGNATEVTLPGVIVNTAAFAADGAGNLFLFGFTGVNYGDPTIVRLTHGALTATWPIPGQHSGIQDFAIGSDCALWFAQLYPYGVGRMTMSGAFSDVVVPGNHGTLHIVAGSDGNLWASSDDHSSLFRITPAGVVTVLPVPANALAASGNHIWFTADAAYGWVDVNDLTVRSFSRPSGFSRPAIATMASGGGWFAEHYAPVGPPCPPFDPIPGQPPPPACNPATPPPVLRLVHFAATGEPVTVPLFSPIALILLAAALCIITFKRT